MPQRKKTGKEISIYISDKNLAFVDGLVEQGKFKTRSASIDAIVSAMRGEGTVVINPEEIR